jgi:hypothetical protein
MEGVRQDGGERRWGFLVCPDPDVLFLTFKEKKKSRRSRRRDGDGE